MTRLWSVRCVNEFFNGSEQRNDPDDVDLVESDVRWTLLILCLLLTGCGHDIHQASRPGQQVKAITIRDASTGKCLALTVTPILGYSIVHLVLVDARFCER